MIHPSFISGLRNTTPNRLSIASFDDGVSTVRRGVAIKKSTKTELLHLTTSPDGLLDWEEGSPIIPGMKKRRRGIGASVPDGTTTVSFERLEPSKITSMLAFQDAKFTPSRGLRRWANNKLVQASLPDSGAVLLFVHGTFSNGDNVINSMKEIDHGSEFLKDAGKKYSAIFAFDHPTISVGPIFNALDLQRAIGKSKAKIDIITHSRGGLVTRWWCETCDPQLERCRNAILVGSPLAGTGLAAPPNIRKTLKLLTNYGNALSAVTGVATAALPVLGIVNTLLQVITSMTSLAASTPIADAIMAMIPGLFAQSRVGNNPELARLHQANGSADRYAAVIANFQTADPGWKFWKYFSKGKLADVATDMIFSGHNDLVVDTDSMLYLSELVRINSKRTHDFETTDRVHHVNYFAQPETTALFRKILNL